MKAYYNEIDPFAAEWLRNLIAAGLIAPGDVDTRSITDVRADDVRGYGQCHFFAGIGGWSRALRLAGVPDGAPIWTGSCPCQPFSAAGKRHGTDDPRHLWPEFLRLIAKCQPPVCFGEQVASAIRHGWIDGVQADLEAAGYAVGYHVLGAHSVGSPHIRQRLWWVAYTETAEWWRMCDTRSHSSHAKAGGCGAVGGLAHTDSRGSSTRCEAASTDGHGNPAEPDGGADPWSDYEWIECGDGKTRRLESGLSPLAHGIPARVGRLRGYGNAIVPQVAAEFVTAFFEAVGK